MQSRHAWEDDYSKKARERLD